MDVYDVVVRANLYVLASSNEEAEAIVRKELEGIDASLPARAGDFVFDAYCPPNQAEYMKKRAINYNSPEIVGV